MGYKMGGGLMQLVAMGAQDVYLTGNPTFGSSVTCTLARNGDLVQEIYLRAVLKCTVDTDGDFFRLEDVTSLIKTVEVEIGGQKIDKHYSQWLDIYNELFETSHDYRAVMNSGNGRIKNKVTSDAPAADATVSDPNNNNQDHQVVTAYVPLRFWFNRNPGLALPLIALQYHEVKVNVTLGGVGDLYGVTKDEAPGSADSSVAAKATAEAGVVGVALSSADLLVNYLYLDTDERRRFAQVSHEYLIEQVQNTGVDQIAASDTNKTVTLTFNHPVKALFWAGMQKTQYNAKIQLNGHDRAAEQSALYYTGV